MNTVTVTYPSSSEKSHGDITAMANEVTGRESDKFMLRLPEGMRERLKAAAKANGRSMNAEIVARLDAADYDIDAVSSDRSDAPASSAVMGGILEHLAHEFEKAAIENKQTPITEAFLNGLNSLRYDSTVRFYHPIKGQRFISQGSMSSEGHIINSNADKATKNKD